MQILEDVMIQLNKYTTMQPWRPSLMDIWVYDRLLSMHENDYDNGSSIPDYLWRKTPDEIMQHIIDSPKIFDMEYGWDSFDDDVRNYLTDNNFIVDPMNVSDEEYQNNLEGKNNESN